MNYRAIVYYIGLTLKLESFLMLPPLLISVFNGDYSAVRGFAVTLFLMTLLFLVIDAWKNAQWQDQKKIYTRESFLVVAVCWVCLSLFGALPFLISGEINDPSNALFESISGFTTTGATILDNVEGLSRGMLFWRSASHWIGGMGVLVLMTVVTAGDGGINMMRAESSGPAPGKLVPKLKQNTFILYGIYICMTAILVVLLLLGGMPLYDSIVNAFSTAGTGGFAITNNSIAAYNSLYLEVVITIFMLLFGLNFNIYFYLLTKNFRAILKHDEFKAYLIVVAAAIILITWNISSVVGGPGVALRQASFQVSSLITTTGFSTTDYSLWPQFSKMILFMVTLCGACSGSTSGGLKLCRIVILLKEIRRSLYRMSRPRAVEIVRMDGKAVGNTVVHSVGTYLITYTILFMLSLLFISFDNFSFETSLTSVLACMGNAGPGFDMVSPTGNFSNYSSFSKIVFSLDMLLGRLEIYPILLLFAPRTWRSV